MALEPIANILLDREARGLAPFLHRCHDNDNNILTLARASN